MADKLAMKFSSASVDSHVDNFGRIGAITYCCYKISQCLKNKQSTGCPQAGAFGGASEAFRKRLAQHGCGLLAGLRPTRPGPAGNGNARKSFGERLAIIRGGGAFAGALRVNSLRAHDMPPLDDSDEFEPFAGFDDALFAEAEAVTSFSKRAQASRADKAKPAAAKERSRAETSPSDGSRGSRGAGAQAFAFPPQPSRSAQPPSSSAFASRRFAPSIMDMAAGGSLPPFEGSRPARTASWIAPASRDDLRPEAVFGRRPPDQSDRPNRPGRPSRPFRSVEAGPAPIFGREPAGEAFATSFTESPDAVPSESAGRAIGVSDAVERLRGAVSGVLAGVWVSGEVAAVTVSSAGHAYFSIKDERGLLECVLFGGARARSGSRGFGGFGSRTAKQELFEIGERIEVTGSPDVYAPRGKLQLVVTGWRPAGAGSLHEAFLRLRAKLEREGLFAAESKKSLPTFVRSVALVTSASAAACGDVLRTLERRTPWVRVLHAETLVQGGEAPQRIVAALRAADASGADVVLLVRGGGAYEDLQAFNDERVARAIFAMATPVISGIGHETDVTIADFVADLRASTPTAAAESIGADAAHWMKRLEKLRATLETTLERTQRHAEERFDRAELAMPDPWSRLRAMEARMDRVAALLSSPDRILAGRLDRVRRVAGFLAAPEGALAAHEQRRIAAGEHMLAVAQLEQRRREERLGRPAERLEPELLRRLERFGDALSREARALGDPGRLVLAAERRLGQAAAALALADPDRPLRAGYVRVVRGSGAGDPVMRAGELAPGERISILFSDGRAEADVKGVTLGRIGG